jgi:hypothetical protein
MDQIRSAINSFTGGNNGQTAQQAAPGTSSGGNFLGGLDNNGQNLQHTGQGVTGGGRLGRNEYPQQTPQGTSGGGNYAGGLGSDQYPPQTAHQQTTQGTTGGGGFLAGLGNKLNAAAGGGPESEKNEDLLDKGELA